MESPLTSSLLTPMLALVCWSLVMLLWMYATRIPAMGRVGIKPGSAQEPSALNALPIGVRQVGYNYNHLMEQPTIFYALVVYSYLAGQQNGPNLILAWLYVALRVIHSVVQATVNVVLVRFSIFALASAVLVWLAAIDVRALFDS